MAMSIQVMMAEQWQAGPQETMDQVFEELTRMRIALGRVLRARPGASRPIPGLCGAPLRSCRGLTFPAKPASTCLLAGLCRRAPPRHPHSLPQHSGV